MTKKQLTLLSETSLLSGKPHPTHLPEEFIEQHSELPWREMRDMRNIVVHEYFGVDNLFIWDTYKNPLRLASLREPYIICVNPRNLRIRLK